MKKGQASFEYLLVVGAVFVLAIPAAVFFASSAKATTFGINLVQFEEAGRTVVAAAESVYYSGIGSRTTVAITLPKGVVNASITDQRELVFGVDSTAGQIDLVFLSDVNLTMDPVGTCGVGDCLVPELTVEGLREITIQSYEGEVTLLVTQ